MHPPRATVVEVEVVELVEDDVELDEVDVVVELVLDG